MSSVKIVMTGHGRGQVFVDGVEVEGVSGLSFSAGSDRANKLVLELVPETVEVTDLDASVRRYVNLREPRDEKTG